MLPEKAQKCKPRGTFGKKGTAKKIFQYLLFFSAFALEIINYHAGGRMSSFFRGDSLTVPIFALVKNKILYLKTQYFQ